ncbi:MAG TPA: putative Ig domain-containing protein [Solirubrobacterales bacterium]|nr:putative Ig domain-containing protein [Solirubrobacterales bacterium]
MRIRIGSVLLLLVCGLGLLFQPLVSPAAAASSLGGDGPGEYVALGDSYASGEGLNPIGSGGYFPGTDDTAQNLCHRSSLAYGPAIASALEAAGRIDPGAWLMPACSGDLISNLSIGSINDFSPGQTPQLDRLSSLTRQVTITIGGNDAGFAGIIAFCLEEVSKTPPVFLDGSSLSGCESRIANANALISDGSIARGLVGLFRTILQRAPRARLVVTTYPLLLPANTAYTGLKKSGRRYCPVNGPLELKRFGFRDTIVAKLNQVESRMNQLIAKTAQAIRVDDGLPGRIGIARLNAGELAAHPFPCSEGGAPEPYVNGLRLTADLESGAGPTGPERFVSRASFHPTAAGHAAFAATVAEEIAPALGLAAAVTSEGSLVSGRGPVKAHIGAVGREFEVEGRNGTPDWAQINNPLSPPEYTIGFEKVPASGLEVTSIEHDSNASVVRFNAPQLGRYPFQALVVDRNGDSVRRAIDVEVVGRLGISTGALPDGEIDAPYTGQLRASNAVGQLSWEASGLPSGLSLNSATGAIVGAPGSEGTFPIVVTARDASEEATKSLTIEVGPSGGRFYFPGSSRPAVLSGDGRWLAYILPRQISGFPYVDLFIRSTVDGSAPIQASHDPSRNITSGVVETDPPGISDDGRFVTFNTAAALSAADTDNSLDLYMYDRVEDVARFVPDTGFWRPGPPSNDGRYLLALDAERRLWRIEASTGSRIRVDASATGVGADHMTSLEGASLSGDGRTALFSSNAANLTPGDTDAMPDLFLKDLVTGSVSSVTFGLHDGPERLLSGAGGTITDDGRLVAFAASGLADGQWRQMLLDRQTGEYRIVAPGSNRIRISADGSTVAYTRTHVLFPDSVLDRTTYEAQHRGSVTTSPLAVAEVANHSLNYDGHEPRVYGSTPTAQTLGIGDDGRAILWRSNWGYLIPDVYPGGGYFLQR